MRKNGFLSIAIDEKKTVNSYRRTSVDTYRRKFWSNLKILPIYREQRRAICSQKCFRILNFDSKLKSAIEAPSNRSNPHLHNHPLTHHNLHTSEPLLIRAATVDLQASCTISLNAHLSWSSASKCKTNHYRDPNMSDYFSSLRENDVFMLQVSFALHIQHFRDITQSDLPWLRLLAFNFQD